MSSAASRELQITGMKRDRGKQSGRDRWNRLPASLSTIVCVSSRKKARPCLSPFFLGSLADLLATSNPKFPWRTVENSPAGLPRINWKAAEPSQMFNPNIWLLNKTAESSFMTWTETFRRRGTSSAAGGGKKRTANRPTNHGGLIYRCIYRNQLFLWVNCVSVFCSPRRQRASSHLIFTPECS